MGDGQQGTVECLPEGEPALFLIAVRRVEHGQGQRLALLFEAVATLPADEQRVVQAVLDGLIVKHRTKQLAELHT